MKTNNINSQSVQGRCNRPPETQSQNTIYVAALVLSLAFTLLLSGCERSTTGGEAAEKRVADLEKQVAVLKEQNRDLRAKARAVHVFGRSSLGDFFASPEFWNCTYDSSWSDCSSRCSKQTSEGLAACIKNHPEGPDRQRCVNENTERGANCLGNCPVQMSPISPSDCGGGIRPA